MATGCSLKQRGLSTKSDLIGSRLKTALVSELAALTGYSPTLKERVTPAGRSWSVLAMPAQPINDNASGFWVASPRANKGGLPDSHADTSGWAITPLASDGSARGYVGQIAYQKAFLPTCTASKGGPEVNKTNGTGKKLVTVLRPTLTYLSGELGLPGRNLLAAIYEHMMGFPAGMLSAPGTPTAPPSSPKSQPQSDGQS